jgi:chromosome partitioning protein
VPAQDFETLWCLPATIDLAGAERELGSDNDAQWPFRLRNAINTYLESNPVDYIFIDCPPSLGRLTVNALSAVSEVLVPIQCEFYALEGVQQLMQTVELVKQNLNPELAISTILLTMFQRGTNLAVQVADEVRAFFGDKVLDTMIPRNIYVAEAPSFGQSVVTYDSGSKGAVAYVDAAREIAQRGVKQGGN